MKITLVNKTDSGGGAAIACNRLAEALLASGHDIRMVTDKKNSDRNYVHPITATKLEKAWESFRFLYERFLFFLREKSKDVRFAFSMANIGVDISHHRIIKDADIIHLHWINQGFLSLKNIEQLVRLNKPIVWTLHDMWAFTGGCHYSGNCKNYLTYCHECPFLRNPSNDDLSSKIWQSKKKIFQNAEGKITFVCCSDWLRNEAQKSSLLKKFQFETIANPLDILTFRPKNKQEIRKSLGLKENVNYILFGAMNVLDKRKGFTYLKEALNHLKQQSFSNIEILLLGKTKEEIDLPFPVIKLSVISSVQKIVDIYNASDVFVLPSLEDNLPNTVAEAMACGVPVVAFNTGGLPEMIDHKRSGYLAEFCNATDMARGIQWVLHESDQKLISTQTREKAAKKYDPLIISQRIVNLYDSLLKG